MRKKEEEMIIIKQFQDLMMYVYALLAKFNQNEELVLGREIKQCLFRGYELLLLAKKAYSKRDKLKYLNDFDVKLNCLKMYVRLARKQKFISRRNYRAWSFKITNVSNLLGAWVKVCLAR